MPKGNDPSEWLLDRANASCDEILTGSTTLQELLNNLDNLDGIRFNQNIIREFLGGIFNSDSTDKEPGNLDPVEKINDHWNSLGLVPGYPSTTEEIETGTADQGSDIRDPAIPDGDIKDPAVPYPYSNIKDRPIPYRDISDLTIPDSDTKDPPIPYQGPSHTETSRTHPSPTTISGTQQPLTATQPSLTATQPSPTA